VQRKRLTTLLAGLGLTGACATTDTTPVGVPPPVPEPSEGVEPSEGIEPSGLGHAAKPVTPTSTSAREPHFAEVPTAFCNATLQPRDQALVRTRSFLEAWNELAPWVHNPRAHNIPATEIDARIFICGSEQCTIGTPRLTEVTADYTIGVGVMIPGEGEYLVVPDVAEPHNAAPCTNVAEATVVRHGSLLHIRATTLERRYNYHHGYAYGDYEPAPLECELLAKHWRDLVIDATSGELELVIDQFAAEDVLEPAVALEFGDAGLVLRGCGTTLELQWTQD
jgi:hypothetical protein